MKLKNTLNKIGRTMVFTLAISGSMLICSFYTHPDYMEEQLSVLLPFVKNARPQQPEPPQPKAIEPAPTEAIEEEECFEYKVVSRQLNDKYPDYIKNSTSQKFGAVLKTKDGIKKYYKQKKLFLVDSSEYYVVDSLTHSYAFLTKDAKELLDDVGKRFMEKISNTSLRNTRILVTSLLRTESTVKSLMRQNGNSVRVSSHLHGTSFDIAHNEFATAKTLKDSEIDYLKEMLALALSELRDENRCFVTYERNQACFHIVNKKTRSNS